MIIDIHLFSSIENKFFINLMDYFVPNFQYPILNTFKNHNYKIFKKRTLSVFNNFKETLCIGADFWSTTGQYSIFNKSGSYMIRILKKHIVYQAAKNLVISHTHNNLVK